MPTFYQPAYLTNALESTPLTFQYNYDGSIPLKCLLDNCADLAGNSQYVTRNHTGAAPARYGCWIPVVGDQSDLTNNYAMVQADSFRQYIFFKTIGTLSVLHQTPLLSTGYANGTPVLVLDEAAPYVTTANLANIDLYVNDADGPVILVGILDVGGPIEG